MCQRCGRISEGDRPWTCTLKAGSSRMVLCLVHTVSSCPQICLILSTQLGSFLGYPEGHQTHEEKKGHLLLFTHHQCSRGHSLSNTRCAVHVLGHTCEELQCAWGYMTETTCWCPPDLSCDSTSLWHIVCLHGP